MDNAKTIAPKTAEACRGAQYGRWTPFGAMMVIIAVGTLLRLALAASIGVEIDGTYSAVISRQLSWSYLDHPPLHLWLIHAFVAVLGESAFAVHLPFVLLFIGTTWFMYRLTALAFGEWAGVWAAAALNLSGALGLVYGLIAVPDGPLFFFLLLAAWLLAGMLFDAGGPSSAHPEGKRHETARWLCAGLAIGLAMLSKYSAALTGAGLVLFMATTPGGRAWLRRWQPWAAGLLAFVMLTPVVIWNHQHGWASFVFQGQRAAPAGNGGLLTLAANVAAQAAYLLPWFFVALAAVLAGAWRAGPRNTRRWFFFCLALFPIAVFTLLNLFQRGLPHWPMPGWLFAVPLLGVFLAGLSDAWRGRMRALALAGLGFVCVFCVAVVAEIRTGVAGAALARALPADVKFRDPLFDLVDWTALQGELARRGLTERDRFVASAHWITAAKAGFGIGPRLHPILLCAGEPHHFPYMTPWETIAGTDGFIVERADLLPAALPCLQRHFAALERLADIELRRGDRPGVTLAVMRARGLSGP